MCNNNHSLHDPFNYPFLLSILCVGACDKLKTELIYRFVYNVPKRQIWKAEDIPEEF